MSIASKSRAVARTVHLFGIEPPKRSRTNLHVPGAPAPGMAPAAEPQKSKVRSFAHLPGAASFEQRRQAVEQGWERAMSNAAPRLGRVASPSSGRSSVAKSWDRAMGKTRQR